MARFEPPLASAVAGDPAASSAWKGLHESQELENHRIFCFFYQTKTGDLGGFKGVCLPSCLLWRARLLTCLCAGLSMSNERSWLRVWYRHPSAYVVDNHCCRGFTGRLRNSGLGIKVPFSNRSCLTGLLGSDLMIRPRSEIWRCNHMEEHFVISVFRWFLIWYLTQSFVIVGSMYVGGICRILPWQSQEELLQHHQESRGAVMVPTKDSCFLPLCCPVERRTPCKTHPVQNMSHTKRVPIPTSRLARCILRDGKYMEI